MTLITGFGFRNGGSSGSSPSPVAANIRYGKVPVAYNGGAGTVITFTTPFTTLNWQFSGRIYCHDALGGEIAFQLDPASRNMTGFTVIPTDDGFVEYECIDPTASYVFNLAYATGYTNGTQFQYKSNGTTKTLNLTADKTPTEVAGLLTAMGDATWVFSTDGGTYNRFTATSAINVITNFAITLVGYSFVLPYVANYNAGTMFSYYSNAVLKNIVTTDLTSGASVATLLTAIGDATWTFSTDLVNNTFLAIAPVANVITLLSASAPSAVFNLPYTANYQAGQIFGYNANVSQRQTNTVGVTARAAITTLLNAVGDGSWYMESGVTFNTYTVRANPGVTITNLDTFNILKVDVKSTLHNANPNAVHLNDAGEFSIGTKGTGGYTARSSFGGTVFSEVPAGAVYSQIYSLRYPKTFVVSAPTNNGALGANSGVGTDQYSYTNDSGVTFVGNTAASALPRNLIVGSWKATSNKQEILFLEFAGQKFLKYSLVTNTALYASFASPLGGDIETADSWATDLSAYSWTSGGYDFYGVKQHLAVLTYNFGVPTMNYTNDLGATWFDITSNMNTFRPSGGNWNKVMCNIEGSNEVVYLGCMNQAGKCIIIRKDVTAGTPWTVVFDKTSDANALLLNMSCDWKSDIGKLFVLTKEGLGGTFQMYKTLNAFSTYNYYSLSAFVGSVVNDFVYTDDKLFGCDNQDFFNVVPF